MREVQDWRDELPSQCASTVPPELGRLILSLQEQLGELSIATVKFQLEEHEKFKKSGSGAPSSSLFEVVASKVQDLIGVDETNFTALEQLEDSVLKRALGKWDKLPYPAWRVLRKRQASSQLQEREAAADEPEPKRRKTEELVLDEEVDEWIIKNERSVRDEMYQQDALVKEQRWNAGAGLVRLSAHADAVFSNSTIIASGKGRKIVREDVDGYKILNLKRAPFVYIQPSIAEYAQTFETMTQGVFKGLDWSNVVVAGGLALGALLCVGEPDSPNKVEQRHDSDVDLYIYGLGPTAANEKIRHIYDTFKANIPNGQETLVVRNSKTISILSKYPTRRVQIVLKAVQHPKEVLLNFDLDICAVAYDGTEVWMLPRTARALETGYNVFTMDMVQGHYLGDRRATQEQRVFKYATKGYGIRFLPSYVASYHESLPLQDNWVPTWGRTRPPRPRTLDYIASLGRKWTTRFVDSGHVSHAMIDPRSQQTWESAARTCLSGFELFMRHVALWEGDARGEWKTSSDRWHSSAYPDGLGGYDDTPKYEWNDSFQFANFERAIDEYNETLSSDFGEGLEESNEQHWVNYKLSADIQRQLARMRYGKSATDVLQPSADLLIPVMLPEGFLTFARETMNAVFKDHNIPELAENLLRDLERLPSSTRGSNEDVIVVWRITESTMWQQIDRRLDEINELLWTFQRSGCDRLDREDLRAATVRMQISRRSVRLEREDELKAFREWADRRSESDVYYEMGGMQWNSNSEEDEEDEDNDDDDSDEEDVSSD